MVSRGLDIDKTGSDNPRVKENHPSTEAPESARISGPRSPERPTQATGPAVPAGEPVPERVAPDIGNVGSVLIGTGFSEKTGLSSSPVLLWSRDRVRDKPACRRAV